MPIDVNMENLTQKTALYGGLFARGERHGGIPAENRVRLRCGKRHILCAECPPHCVFPSRDKPPHRRTNSAEDEHRAIIEIREKRARGEGPGSGDERHGSGGGMA